MTADPVTAIIVDDEELAIERLVMLCAAIEGVTVIGTAADGDAALALVERLNPELVLLDISMPELDGMSMARQLAGKDPSPIVVFCTAFENFAVEAFDVAAVDYLLKPVTTESLARAIDRARDRLANRDASGSMTRWTQQFWVPYRGELRRVDVNDIERIEADRDYMRLHVGGRVYLLHQTIGRLEERLDPKLFIRIHRSHIVRRDRIERIAHSGLGAWSVQLASGSTLRIGKSYVAKVKKIASDVAR